MKVKLITTNNPQKVPEVLRKKSKKVEEITPDLLELAEEMKKIMNENNGIGLSAIQVGVPLRLMTIKDGDGDHIFINPEIKKLSKKECIFNEGCLSFPDIFNEIKRPEKVLVRAIDSGGRDVEIKAEGILARCLQHEIDHMEGVVFVDHVEKNM